MLHAFLNSLEIDFYSEEQEDEALYIAMKKGRKSLLLNENEKKEFLLSLKRLNDCSHQKFF